MLNKIVDVLKRKSVEVKKEMNVNNERIALTKDTEGSSECTDLIVQEEALPQEQEKEEPATGITATTEFIGDMDDYDRAVET